MGIPHFDKILHAGAYAVLAFLWVWAASRSPGFQTVWLWYIALACIFIGCTLEAGQYFLTSGRSFEWWDMVANAVGAVLGSRIFLPIFFQKK
jgi:VanZ family protein